MTYVKAKIESTSITVTDCGVTVFDLTISGDGFPRQKFGGMFDFVPFHTIFAICDAERWEDLPGKEVFADVMNGKIVAISDSDGNFRFGYHVHMVGTEILGEG